MQPFQRRSERRPGDAVHARQRGLRRTPCCELALDSLRDSTPAPEVAEPFVVVARRPLPGRSGRRLASRRRRRTSSAGNALSERSQACAEQTAVVGVVAVALTVVGLPGCSSRCDDPAAGAELAGCDLSGRALASTDLTNADLSEADLSGAVLLNANLTSVNLSGAVMSRVVLDGARLPYAPASEARTWPAPTCRTRT